MFPYTFISWCSTQRKSFLFLILLVIFLLIFGMGSWNFILFHGFWSVYYLFSCWNCPQFGQFVFHQADSSVLLMFPHHSLNTSFLSGTTRYFGLIFCFPFPSPKVRHVVLSGVWYLETKTGFQMCLLLPGHLVSGEEKEGNTRYLQKSLSGEGGHLGSSVG